MSQAEVPMVKAEAISKSYGSNEVLKSISLEVKRGEVLCLVGPSGSGKSTFLRCINHLETINAGRLWVDGELVGYRQHGDKIYEMHPKEAAKQRRDIGHVCRLQLEQPVGVGVSVDGIGCVHDVLIDGDNFPGDWCVEVGRGLDRLDHCTGFARAQLATGFRQFEEDDVAQRLLCVIGDPDRQAAVLFAADPFVGLGVLEVGGKRAHGVLQAV